MYQKGGTHIRSLDRYCSDNWGLTGKDTAFQLIVEDILAPENHAICKSETATSLSAFFLRSSCFETLSLLWDTCCVQGIDICMRKD